MVLNDKYLISKILFKRDYHFNVMKFSFGIRKNMIFMVTDDSIIFCIYFMTIICGNISCYLFNVHLNLFIFQNRLEINCFVVQIIF